MSELAIITSDIHIHSYKAFNEGGRRLKNGIAYLEYIFKLADTNKIKYILLPGDIFDKMHIMATSVVNAVTACLKENFEKYPNIIIISVSGNHDQSSRSLYNEPCESALDYLNTIFDNFKLLGNTVNSYLTEAGNSVVGIRYYEHSEHFRKVLEELGKNRMPGKVHLLTHQTIGSGLPIEDTIESIDPLFDPFDFIYNAHIHTAEQLTDKMINIGNPQARDAGDIGKAKGFWIVDLDDPINTIGFKDISDKYPKFVHKTTGEELTEEDKNNYVIWQPAQIADNVKDQKLAEKFSTNLAPTVIMENYCREVLPENELKDKLQYGLTLLS
jgi:DNA repair exonuclease SbcCD nuclease subunit